MSESATFPFSLVYDEPGPARDNGVERVFLKEIEFQCKVGNLAWDRLHEALKDQTPLSNFMAWDAIQSLMVACGNIAKLLDGSQAQAEHRHIAVSRGKRLRDLTKTTGSSVLLDRALRNDLEHFDERLDLVLADIGWHIHLDRAIHRNGVRMAAFRNNESADEIHPLRQLELDRDRLTVLGRDLRPRSIDLSALRLELGRLHGEVDALLERPAVKGRYAVRVHCRIVPAE